MPFSNNDNLKNIVKQNSERQRLFQKFLESANRMHSQNNHFFVIVKSIPK